MRKSVHVLRLPIILSEKHRKSSTMPRTIEGTVMAKESIERSERKTNDLYEVTDARNVANGI